MKYIKAIDLWTYGDAVRNGQIKLQSGQWIRLGPNGQLSRFRKANKHHIQAFHGETPAKATAKYLMFVREVKEADAHLAALRAAKKAGIKFES
mgnify:CR=1 FL=1